MLLCPNFYSSLFLCAAATVFCTGLVPQACMPWLGQEGLIHLQVSKVSEVVVFLLWIKATRGELGCLGLLLRKLLVIEHP